MTNRGSEIPFRSAGTSGRVDVLADARVSVSSEGLGWQGLVVEAGTNPSWEIDNVAIDGHYVALNAGPAPLLMEPRLGRSFTGIVVPPGSLWLQPAGEGISLRVPSACEYASVVLDAERMARSVSARRVVMRPAFGVRDDQLAHVLQAVVAEARGGGALGALYADALFEALAVHLALRYGDVRAPAGRAVLAPQAVGRVLEYIEAHLHDDLRVEDLAGIAGTSAQYFARAFKRHAGEPPHAFVLRRRLERARDAVRTSDEPLFAIAQRLGFADQAHLTRLFRRRFGAPPGAYRRRNR
jgi:AraC family transcriptional regulator